MAKLNGQALDLSSESWFSLKNKDEKSASVEFETLDPNAEMTITLNKKAIAKNESNFHLEPGYNLVEIHVEAPDKTTIKDYRLQIFRNGDGNDELTSLKVNNGVVNVAADNTAQAIIPASANTAVIEAITASANSTATVYDESGKEVTSAVPLEGGRNTFYVKVQTETLKSPRIITLTLLAQEPSSVLLDSASFDEVSINQKLDAYETGYTGDVTKSVFGYTFKAKEEDSLVEVFLNDKETPETSGNGEVTWASLFDQTKENNVLKVKITSADKSRTKTYTFDLAKQTSFYLSDFTWENVVEGYSGNPTTADQSCNGHDITLKNESGQTVTYEKGIGTHANSKITIDLSQKERDFNKFEAMVGVDTNCGTSEPDRYPKLVFSVIGIDASGKETTLATSGQMMLNTPAEKLSADLGDSVKLRLEMNTAVTGMSNLIGNAHGNWADAKVSSTFDAAEATFDASSIEGDGTVELPEGTLYEGMYYQLKAKPKEGETFLGWQDAEGNTISTDETITVQFGSDLFKGLKAVFTKTEVPPVPVQLDYSVLDQAIAKAQKTVDAKANFSTANMTALQTALNNAKNTRKDAREQGDIDSAAAALGDALLKVRLTPAASRLEDLK